MPSFLACQGEVVTLTIQEGSGTGWYKLGGLQGDPQNPIILNGGNFSIGDVTDFVTTLGKNKVAYAFGEAWGTSTINGMVLLGNNKSGGKALSTVVDFFKGNRVSAVSEAIKYSGPGGWSANAFLHGLVIAEADPMYNIQQFAFLAAVETPEA